MLMTRRGAHSPQCRRAICLQTAGVESTSCLRKVAARDEKVQAGEYFAPFLSFGCVCSKSVGFSTTWQVMTVSHTAERGLVRNNGNAESRETRGHRLCFEIHNDMI